MKCLVPNLFLDKFQDINFSDMRKLGIKGFIFDIDNTLVTYAQPLPTTEVRKWIELVKDEGFKIFILSNNSSARAKVFSNSLNIDFFSKAGKPKKKYFKAACRNMRVLPKETAVVGDQIFTDILGGNRMGMYTIFVKQISTEEGAFVKFKRKFERLLLKGMMK